MSESNTRSVIKMCAELKYHPIALMQIYKIQKYKTQNTILQFYIHLMKCQIKDSFMLSTVVAVCGSAAPPVSGGQCCVWMFLLPSTNVCRPFHCSVYLTETTTRSSYCNVLLQRLSTETTHLSFSLKVTFTWKLSKKKQVQSMSPLYLRILVIFTLKKLGKQKNK